jgi:hypothetical protein
VVKERPKECGEHVLSLIANLLQTCSITPISLSAAIEAICLCVRANIVDARTGKLLTYIYVCVCLHCSLVWTVLVSHVAETAKMQTEKNPLVFKSLCRFFALAGEIREGSILMDSIDSLN